MGIVVGLCCATTASAATEFGLVPGSFKADTFDPALGGPDNRAGAHPNEAFTDFDLNVRPDGNPVDALRSVSVSLPDGFVGDPRATPTCSRGTFDAFVSGAHAANFTPEYCPVSSQVGYAIVRGVGTTSPVYNVEPSPGEVADFAFISQAVPIHIIPSLDPARNYALKVRVDKTSQAIPASGSRVILWGVPSDSSHDDRRSCDGGPDMSATTCSVSAARAPFLTNPSECGGPLTTTLAVDSWQAPGVFKSASYTTATGVFGCERLRFAPTVDLHTDTRADAPSGLSVDLEFPFNGDADGFGTPPLRTATVTLPEGMSINPASAGGLQACTDAQLGLKSDTPVGCPEGSKIGTVTATTPVLAQPLTGSLYVRTQNSDDPESGEMFRLALVVADKDRGILVKLAGTAKANKNTGRVVAQFAENPQLPVSKLSLALKSGPRAPLATPAGCGNAETRTQLSSWAGSSVDRSSTTTIECRSGLGDFAPGFHAGVDDTSAGASSPFGLVITKPDGYAAVDGLRMELPTGLVARLKGNLNTQVGTATAYVGPGSNPFALLGKVFLEGAYDDAPFSLRVVVPAKAGPFDLGEVVVRQKIYVDPIDAHVTVVSNPVPTIVKGVPARLQRLEVSVDKAGFMVNPTSCTAKAISGTLHSAAGQSAAVTARFQISACSDLTLKPVLGLVVGQGSDD